ncbi:MAG: ABC-F family ATP-binding cassette domain-containing protein [Deltaproteobacteria bacterium]|nr:ABC-F family ATP-binding cassette domain-containing protein [Deltaproteobacteria bacterium]
MLYINNLTFRLGGRTLFEDASAHVPAGHRVGLVGSNGTGKTTLLRMILGRHELDGGAIRVRSHCRVGIVAQEAPSGDKTPLDEVLAADTLRTTLMSEAKSAKDPDRIAEIHTRLAEVDAHSAPARAAGILAGLGFDELSQSRALSTFSGGWRMRVALAAVLFSEPDLLLLDEPTNHLDLESALWLENHLRTYPHTLLMVSHDRSFLNIAVDHILNLNDNKLEMFSGGFDAFERVYAARLVQTEAAQRNQEAQSKRLQSFIDRFRAKATKARQAQSRVKVLERMMPVAMVPTERKVVFRFPKPAPATSPLARLDEAAVEYEPGRPILRDLHLSVFDTDRIALLGSNGNGKTTLARLLSDKLTASSGRVVRSSKLRIGYFAQDQLEQLEPTLNALEQMRVYMPDDPPPTVRGWLGRFGLGQDKVEVPVSGLSGGEKTRLALALVALEKPNLLVLDEPTNHLDMDSRRALIEALADYSGAIILVSHDRHLIEATADQLWIVKDGTAKAFFGDLDEYRDLVLEEGRSLRAARRKARATDGRDRRDRKEERRTKAEERTRLAPLRKRAQEAEVNLEKLTAEKDDVDAALSDPAIYSGPEEKVVELSRRQRELEKEIEESEEQWLEAQSELEEASDQ